MEEIVRVARSLREEHDFRGYIHLKAIPGASPELIEAAGRTPTVSRSMLNFPPMNRW